MSYLGGGPYHAETCPICGETMWNGCCENPNCHNHWHPVDWEEDDDNGESQEKRNGGIRMQQIINRTIAGDKVKLYAYDGKMRLRVTGSFYSTPEGIDDTAAANRMAATRFGDGSISIKAQTLIDSNASERSIEHEYELMLCKMEDLFGFKDGSCSSSSWYVGHHDDTDDGLLTDDERDWIRLASKEALQDG